MVFKKKSAKKKPMAKPEPKIKYQSVTLFYRDGSVLYRLETDKAVPAPRGGLDLSVVPEGKVSKWEGVWVSPATLPETARHTKNTAGVGA